MTKVGTPTFEILPAIDLRAGRVVRLRQGDFGQETVYDADPVEVAIRFADAGARWLHIVDLDAARTGIPSSGDAIRAIVGAVGERVSIEIAGGLRSEAAVAVALEGGARRVVVATAALRDPVFVGRLIGVHGPDRVVVALDVRDGRAVGEGWREGGPGHPVAVALQRIADEGARTFEVTSIRRDGLLRGPDLALLRRLVARDRGAIVASGGISSIDDLRSVRDHGCAGAIIGRALYENHLSLHESLREQSAAIELQPPTTEA
jgi:phosphoribosylformimino-5-aminoimidazole carboxamide ribotide isomerase